VAPTARRGSILKPISVRASSQYFRVLWGSPTLGSGGGRQARPKASLVSPDEAANDRKAHARLLARQTRGALPCSKAGRMAGEPTSSRNRKTIAASVKFCIGGKFCLNKFFATLTAAFHSRVAGVARLPARHTILDVIGCLLTNCCQVSCSLRK